MTSKKCHETCQAAEVELQIHSDGRSSSWSSASRSSGGSLPLRRGQSRQSDDWHRNPPPAPGRAKIVNDWDNSSPGGCNDKVLARAAGPRIISLRQVSLSDVLSCTLHGYCDWVSGLPLLCPLASAFSLHSQQKPRGASGPLTQSGG